VTKRELAEFYSGIWKWIAPYVIDRPLALVRCPEGATSHCFFQKHAWSGLDDELVHRRKSAGEEILSINSLDGLIALVQADVLEIHPWGTTIDDMGHADQVTFDLDPGEGVGWKEVVAAARLVRKKLEAAGLVAFLKTTGGKGLHVVTPLSPAAKWEDAKSFAQAIALEMEDENPERFIATSSKRDRAGKIFIDYLRNSRGATAVAAYSTRARAGAPVSTPLFWEELGPRLRSDRFTVSNIEKRLSGLKSDPWRAFHKSGRPLPDEESEPGRARRKTPRRR
jgi:bifunctional non-homologous end joining protein LigD